MSAKQNKQTQALTELTLPGEARNNKYIKRYLKEESKKAERAKIDAKTPKLVKYASELFGEEFETFGAVVKYLTPRKAKSSGKRSARITDEQKKQVKELRKQNTTDEQIAEKLSLSVQQVKRVS